MAHLLLGICLNGVNGVIFKRYLEDRNMNDIKTIRDKIRKLERAKLRAQGKSEFFGMLVVDNMLEKAQKELEEALKTKESKI